MRGSGRRIHRHTDDTERRIDAGVEPGNRLNAGQRRGTAEQHRVVFGIFQKRTDGAARVLRRDCDAGARGRCNLVGDAHARDGIPCGDVQVDIGQQR